MTLVTDRVVFKNTAYQVIGKVANSLLGIVTLSFLTRYLGPIGFSEYGIIFGFVGLLILLPDFGLSPLLIREIAAKREGKEYFAKIFTFRLVLSLSLLILASIGIFFFPYSSTVKVGILLATVANIAILLSSLYWSLFQAFLTYKFIVLSQLIQSILLVFLIFLGVSLQLPLLYFVVANIVAALCMLLISYFLSPYKQLPFFWNKKEVFRIARQAFPFAGWTIVSILYLKLDTILLSFYFNPSKTPDVGLYALSYRIFEVAMMLGGYFTQTLYPVFSQQLGNVVFPKSTTRYLWYTIILALGSGGLMYFLADPFVRIVSGIDYAPAIESVQILSIALVFTILSGYFLAITASGGGEKKLFIFSGIALVINIFLNVVFIPQYSFIAASWVTVVTQAFVCLTNIFLALQVIRMKPTHAT